MWGVLRGVLARVFRGVLSEGGFEGLFGESFVEESFERSSIVV